MAREYERLRGAMPSGAERTHRLELVVEKMRTLALAAAPKCAELRTSGSAGDRLMALATLQLQPDVSAIPWIEQRFAAETPFIQYHAAIALLSAARAFGRAAQRPLERALEAGYDAARRSDGTSDRERVLRAVGEVIGVSQRGADG
ncbi:MAG: hypothetical protein H6700_06900 [Myxococcales bacterium]|nr:hypothetical protein [Myxococcales bacterium]